MRIFYFLIISFFLFSSSFAQAQGWETAFSADSLILVGSTGSSLGFKVEPTQDGGYLIAGEVDYPTGAPRHFISLAKADAFGNQVWSHTYNINGVSLEEVSFLKELPDGEILLVGTHNSRPFFYKCNSSGEIIMEKIFENFDSHQVRDAHMDADNNLIIVGYYSIGGDAKMFLLKATLEGDLIWQKYHDFSGFATSFSVDATPDGGLIISGNLSAGFDSKVLLSKVDSLGDLMWYQTYEMTVLDQAHAVKATLDNGYIIGGSVQGLSDNLPLIIKTDSLGNGEWVKILPNGTIGPVTDIIVLEDSTYLLAGSLHSYFVFTNVGFLGQIDSLGEVMWMDEFPADNRSFSDMELTADGGIILAGSINADMLLKKVGGTITSQKNIFQKNGIEISPNPFPSQTTFNIKNQNFKTIQLQVFDMMGKLVRKEIHAESEFIFYKKNLPRGVYFYKIQNENILIGNGKFIISN